MFAPPPTPAAQKPKGPKKQPRAKVKNDPKLVAAARELRDRYLEQFNSGLVLPQGKYQVSRELPICDLQFAIENRQSQIANRKSLPQAA